MRVKFGRAAAIGMSLALLSAGAAWADGLQVDALGDESFATELALGDLCPSDQEMDFDINWYAERSGNEDPDKNTDKKWQSNALLTFTGHSANPVVLTGPSGHDGDLDITRPAAANLPNDWATSSNGTTHAFAGEVHVTPGTVPGNYEGTVKVEASGLALDASTHSAKADLEVTWTVLGEEDEGFENCGAGDPVYEIDGFYQPVENRTRNTMKGGAAVPLKFNILDEDGNKVENDLNLIEVLVQRVTCTTLADEENLLANEELASGKTELRWDGEQYIFNWKSPKVATQTCYRIYLEISGGDSVFADFELRK